MRFRDLIIGLMGQSGPDPTLPTFDTQTEYEAFEEVTALNAGQLPPSAIRRVQRSQSQGVWGSTLDIPDLYLAESIGLEPLCLVAGQACFHAASDYAGRILLDGNNDASYLVQAYYQARDTGLSRLRAEAQLVGAHAVIDAEHTFKAEEKNQVEFSIVGTAVRFKGLAQPQHVLVSPMSGEAFFKLLKIGWLPVDFAFGFHYHTMGVGATTRAMDTSLYNQEVTTITQRFNATRSKAVQALAKDARRRFSADGVVGVDVKTVIHETEILYSNVTSYVELDGSRFYPKEGGRVEVPAVNLEFFASGASVKRIATGNGWRADISAYLAALA